MEEKSTPTSPLSPASSLDEAESTSTNVKATSASGSLVGSRRMLFEQQVVSSHHHQSTPKVRTNVLVDSTPPSSARVSRVSIRTLPLNDRAAYSSASSSSERESRTPSPQPSPLPPSPALLDDSAFAKRTSYHQAVFKSAEMILPSSTSSSSRPKPIDEQQTVDVVVQPQSVAEVANEVDEQQRIPSSPDQRGEEEECVSPPPPPLSSKCQPIDEEVTSTTISPLKSEADTTTTTTTIENEAEEAVVSPSTTTSCPDSVVIISQDLSSARDNDRISSLSSSPNIRESVIVTSANAAAAATTTTAAAATIQEDSCNNDEDEDANKCEKISATEERVAGRSPDPDVDYPDELNPFADDEEEEKENSTIHRTKKEDQNTTISSSKSLNPFGSDSEEDEDTDKSAAATSTSSISTKKREESASTNPFWSGSEEDEEEEGARPAGHADKPKPNARMLENGSRNKTPVPLPRSTIRTSVVNLSPQPSPRRSVDSSPASSRKLSADSLSSRSGSSSAQSTIRKKKPAPPPPPLAAVIARTQNPQPIFAANEQRVTTSPQNDTRDADANKNVPKPTTPKMLIAGSPWKHKKGPAPARPTPQRRPVKEMPLGDIQTEIGDIEVREQELERQGVQLEQMIRERTQTESAESPGVEEMVLQLFELVNEKNELFRRRSELVNMRKMHHLEQEHAELEYQIRCLMLKPASNKTDSDKEKEEELIKKLLDVVERRNEIIETMEKDRQRETVEDQSVTAQLGVAGQGDNKVIKSPDKSKKKEEKEKEKKSKKQAKKDKTKKEDQLLHNGDEKEKHSPGQLIKQKFMTMTLRHSTKKLQSPRLSN